MRCKRTRAISTWIVGLIAVCATVKNRSALCQDAVSQDFIRAGGKHVTIVADTGDVDQLTEFVQAFDASVPQWTQFWQLPDGSLDDWHVTAYIMRDREAFRQAGHLPANLPEFPFGYALGNRVWVIAQKSVYYTRHLLLHEGVHALAFDQFGGAGPSWFMEGTAELLAVHSGSGASVKINSVPRDRESVPYWGRFKLLSQRRGENRVPSLETVMGYPRNLNSDVESYGWSWAAAMLLANYDDYAGDMRRAARGGRDSSFRFNRRLPGKNDARWPVLCARWRLMCQTLDYGFNWQRERVELSTKDPIWDSRQRKISVAADQGWQSVGVRLAPGAKLRLSASGQCELAQQPKPWISEPAGITFRYYRGRPLGQLIAMLVPNACESQARLKPFEVFSIEKTSTLTITEYCWLVLRINDAVGELEDNQGGYSVELETIGR